MPCSNTPQCPTPLHSLTPAPLYSHHSISLCIYLSLCPLPPGQDQVCLFTVPRPGTVLVTSQVMENYLSKK